MNTRQENCDKNYLIFKALRSPSMVSLSKIRNRNTEWGRKKPRLDGDRGGFWEEKDLTKKSPS
jgi:hypothetical protein